MALIVNIAPMLVILHVIMRTIAILARPALLASASADEGDAVRYDPIAHSVLVTLTCTNPRLSNGPA